MHRLLFLMIMGVASLPAMAATTATPGQWSTIVATFDSSDNHYLLKTTTTSDPETCMAELNKIAGKVNETGGYVWTTPDKKNMSYQKEESPPNYEYKQSRVLELRCVLEPFEGELVRK